jgi:hypothetical protein
MRPKQDLSELSDAFCTRIDRLVTIFATRPFGAGSASETDRLAAYCTIELANAWAQFVRSYYLSCGIGARRRSGARVRHTGVFRDYDDALLQSSRVMGKRVRGAVPTPAEEPDWSAPPTLIKLSQTFAFTNQTEIGAAFGITTSIFPPLITCRNFFAHRCKATADKIEGLSRRLALPLHRRAALLVCSSSPVAPHTIFERWCGLIQAVGSALSA